MAHDNSIAADSIEGKTVLVTGAAGSIGSRIVESMLERGARSVRAFDVDEYGVVLLKRHISRKGKDLRDRTRFLLGDIVDRDRVRLALQRVDVVIHAAALKHVDLGEYNPIQFLRVNVDGTINMVEECLLSQPEKFLFLSSDKAVNFSNLYGATKFVGEKVVSWANHVSEGTKFSSARFGNVFETRGNVFDIWSRQKEDGDFVTVTDPEMTRFFWSIDEAVSFVNKILGSMSGGEIFIPRMEEHKIGDLAGKFGGQVKIVGARPGEKLRERLWAPHEKPEWTGDYWVIK